MSRMPPGPVIAVAAPQAPDGDLHPLAETLLRLQAPRPPAGTARMVRLPTTRPDAGGSFARCAAAVVRLAQLRLRGRVAGLHVVVAEPGCFLRGGGLLLAGRALGVPAVLHLHGALPALEGPLALPLRHALRRLCLLASGVVVGTEGERRVLAARLALPADRIDTVVCGVSGPPQRPTRAAAGHLLQVVFAGPPAAGRRFAELLHGLTLARVDRERVRLTLVGRGDAQDLRQLARDLGLGGSVRFAGGCSRAQFAHLLQEADLLVSPPPDEALPLAVLDAFAHAVPVICPPAGELPAYAIDGVHAVFVPAGDLRALAVAVEELLADPPRRTQLGQRGRVLYEQRFSATRFFAEMARVHQRCFGACAQGRPEEERKPG